jgi:outer membrane protein TolC
MPAGNRITLIAAGSGAGIAATFICDADRYLLANFFQENLDWLKRFNDPTLDAIVAEAMANNLDLRQAADRVEAARQCVIVVGAQLLPQIGGQLGIKKTHDFGHEDEVKHTFEHKYGSLGMAWELDVWGRLRAQRAAAGFEATALDYCPRRYRFVDECLEELEEKV